MVFELPTLCTERLVLRGFRPGDLDPYASLNADPVFRRGLGGQVLSRAESWAQMERFMGQWALRGYGMLAVTRADVLVGRVGILHPIEWEEPELAWGIAPFCWGQGLAGEAARAVRTWAVAECGFPRLVSYILADNHPSRRVAEKLGAARQGTTVVRGLTVDRWVHPAPGTGVIA